MPSACRNLCLISPIVLWPQEEWRRDTFSLSFFASLDCIGISMERNGKRKVEDEALIIYVCKIYRASVIARLHSSFFVQVCGCCVHMVYVEMNWVGVWLVAMRQSKLIPYSMGSCILMKLLISWLLKIVQDGCWSFALGNASYICWGERVVSRCSCSLGLFGRLWRHWAI